MAAAPSLAPVRNLFLYETGPASVYHAEILTSAQSTATYLLNCPRESSCPDDQVSRLTVTHINGSSYLGEHSFRGSRTHWDCRLGRSDDDATGQYGWCDASTVSAGDNDGAEAEGSRTVMLGDTQTAVAECLLASHTVPVYVTEGADDIFKSVMTGSAESLLAENEDRLESLGCDADDEGWMGITRTRSGDGYVTNTGEAGHKETKEGGSDGEDDEDDGEDGDADEGDQQDGGGGGGGSDDSDDDEDAAVSLRLSSMTMAMVVVSVITSTLLSLS